MGDIILETAPRMLREVTDLRFTSDPTLPQRLVQIEDMEVVIVTRAKSHVRGGLVVTDHAPASCSSVFGWSEPARPQVWARVRQGRAEDRGRALCQWCVFGQPAPDKGKWRGRADRLTLDGLVPHIRLAERGSPAFDEFLGLMGDRIRLEGWTRYRGGLDVKSTRSRDR